MGAHGAHEAAHQKDERQAAILVENEAVKVHSQHPYKQLPQTQCHLAPSLAPSRCLLGLH